MTLPRPPPGLLNRLGGDNWSDGDLDVGGAMLLLGGTGTPTLSNHSPSCTCTGCSPGLRKQADAAAVRDEDVSRHPFRFTPALLGTSKTDDDGKTLCGTPVARLFGGPHIERDGKAAVVGRHAWCGRPTCPVCGPKWLADETFKWAVRIEAMAWKYGSRPAHVFWSLDPQKASRMTDAELSIQLDRRGIRVSKEMGVKAGVKMPHAYRVRDDIKEQLRTLGYNNGENNGKRGFWEAIREDVLELGDWRDYVKPGQHRHGIVIPGYTKPHSDKKFHWQKIRTLPDVSQTVAAVRYQLSHSTKVEGTNQNMASAFGELFHFDPMDPEQFPQDILEDIMMEVADAMNYIPPDLQEGITDLLPMTSLPSCMENPEWVDRLNGEQFRFFEKIHLSMVTVGDRRAVNNKGESITLYPRHLPWADVSVDAPPSVVVIGLPVDVDEDVVGGADEDVDDRGSPPLEDVLTLTDLVPKNYILKIQRHPKYLNKP